jgi:hypothetical protein
MLRTVKRMVVIAAVATTGMVASVGSVHASAAVRTVSAARVVAVTPPTTNIEGRGSALRWVPRSLTAVHVSGTCSPTNYSFLILNKTRASQQIIYQGSPLFSPIPAKQGLYVCASARLKATFSLQADANAKLKIVIT